MAFLGYFVKINGSVLPNRFIAIESLIMTPNQTQDDDSYEDGDGKLHRNVMPHRRSKMEFNTPPINQADNTILQSYFPNTISMEAEYWNPKKGIYESGVFYTPDMSFTVRESSDTEIKYNPIRIALIEY